MRDFRHKVHGVRQRAVGSWQLAVGGSLPVKDANSEETGLPQPTTDNGLRLTAYGLRLAACGLQLTAYSLQLAALSLLLTACASIAPLEGGLKDETPPKVIEEKSTPNLQTNFFPKRIELTFDEWVMLEDVFNQVVISPPLQYRTDISLKGRTVIVKIDDKETLRAEATYTINFGTAVKDLTERNPADDLRFVFSTGDYIDSMTVEGVIVDAFTGDPVEKALFMLYDNLADSVVRTEKPFYFGRTNKEGRFLIPNVRDDTLKGFALLDADLNYLFNQSKEKIGFPDDLIITSDSSARNIRIRLFEEARPTRLLESEAAAYGRLKLTYSQTPLRFSAAASDTTIMLRTEYIGDSIRIWYDHTAAEPWSIIAQADTSKPDTIEIKTGPARANFLSAARLSVVAPAPASTTVIHPDNPAAIRFSQPVLTIDTTLISWWEDTLRQPVHPVWSPDTAQLRTWNAALPWKEAVPYEIEALPGAFTDMFGIANADTISLKWRIEPRKNFATLNLILEGMEPGAEYVVYLLNSSKAEVLNRRVSGADDGRLTLARLQPGQYSLRIIHDRNGNGKWDSGFYDTYLQPEETFHFPLEQLRGNWEMEAKVNLRPGAAPVPEEEEEGGE